MPPLASAPDPGLSPPAAMRAWAGDAEIELVWQNEVGGLTGFVPARSAYLKWNPATSRESLAAEAERMTWLAARHPAPDVIEFQSTDDGELLATHALPGHSAIRFAAFDEAPERAARAIGVGLRRLHELPIADCPSSWSVTARIAEAERAGLRVDAELRDAPPIDRLVVAHGDPCAPNTLISDGAFVAHVDLARVGVADRWADLAVASMSLDWNGLGHVEQDFWDGYGIAPRPEHVAYYRALWNAT